MHRISFLPVRQFESLVVALVIAIACSAQTQAQPFIVSTVPVNGASGVSPSAAVVFTFNEPMDTALTLARFLDSTTFTALPATSAWSVNDTVLTCTPTPAFPTSKLIVWTVDGESLIGDPLEGDMGGYFTTSSGSGGNSGSGTNQVTAFAVGKTHFYNQTSAGGSTLDPDVPYFFIASTTLASNRTANSVTVTLPTSGAVSNLTRNISRPEMFLLLMPHTNLTLFNNTFPAGNYVFNVAASTSNQQVSVNLSASLAQPSPPHISNFAAAQSMNATQSFQLSWDAFPGGTTADYISVSVGETFRSPDFGAPNALNGTATSIAIPAGTLQSASNYDATITFYRSTGSSNASYTTIGYLATSTKFNVITSGGIVTLPLIFTNAAWAGQAFTFDVLSSAGQFFGIEYSSTLFTNQWQPLLTTNSSTGRVRITHSATNKYLFYRARKIP